jgi:hypothetical protein
VADAAGLDLPMVGFEQHRDAEGRPARRNLPPMLEWY